MNDRELLSISDVASATGLQPSALRYYEKVGLVESQARRGGRRQYDPAVLQRLAVIGLFQEAGFTINELSMLMSRAGARRGWRDLAEDKLREIDEHLERVQATRDLLNAALACECSSLEQCHLVAQRRGRHRKLVQMLTLRPPRAPD